MDDDTLQKLNTLFYLIFIATGLIYLYLTVKEFELEDNEYDKLLTLARKLTLITAIYFLITAIIGLDSDNSSNQYKQVIASLFILLGAITRLTITNDDIEFR